MSTDPNIQKFIKHVRKRCKETGVELKLVDDISVGCGEVKCGGYFDSDNLVLACATIDLQDPIRWVTLLAHEYCHLEQWAENSEIWNSTTIGDYDALTIWDMWLNHYVELNEEQLTKYTNIAMNLELDCEKRTVEVLREFSLPFDIGVYTQRSNAYAIMYQFCKKYRKWNIPGRSPSGMVEVYSILSKEFDMDYYNLPKDYEEMCLKMGCFDVNS